MHEMQERGTMTPSEQRNVLLSMQKQLVTLGELVEAMLADAKPKRERKASEPKIPAFQYQPSVAVKQWIVETWGATSPDEPLKDFRVYFAKESKTQRNWDSTLMKNPVFRSRMDKLSVEHKAVVDIRSRARSIYQAVLCAGRPLALEGIGDLEAAKWIIDNGYMAIEVHDGLQYLVAK